MKKNHIIITNNPKVNDFFSDLAFEVILIDGGYFEVLDETRKKMSESAKNKPPMSDETKRKISEKMKEIRRKKS